ncbi:MAG: hypothetical protein M0R40_09695 [Firmicutes bacterium]|nr:hypothetical protein [Bacillota bacterium]
MKIKSKIRSMALLLAVVIIFSQVPLTVLAEEGEGEVKIINTAGAAWGAFGQYVEYEMDGYTFNTKTAPAYKNREAWSKMTDKQKRTTYNAIYTKSAKKAAFGNEGFQEITLWNKASSSYYKANKLWKSRIAKRDYPVLTAKFGNGRSLATLYPEYSEIASYQIPSAIAWWERAKNFQSALDAVEKEYQIGREYYEKTVEMRTKGIANVVTITITQCTLMLSDMLFVPSVTKGAANEASSQIADIFNVLTGFASMEDSDFNEKFIRYKNGETGVPFTPEETVKLFGALMDTYAKMAENSLPRIDAAMKKLKYRYEMLKAGHQFYLNELDLKEREKAQEKAAYEESLLEKYPSEPIPPSGNYEGLNFSWFTAEQLANQYGESIGYTQAERKAAVFDAVLTKKAELDAEAGSDALILCQNIIDTYNMAADCLAQKALELGILETDVENGCSPETISSYISVDWDSDGYWDFLGNRTFEEALYVDAVTLFKESWPPLLGNLENGKTALTALKASIKPFIDSKDTLPSELEPYLTDLSSYMDQLQQLKDDYWELYNSVVWVPEGYNSSYFINPLNNANHVEYRVNAVSDAYTKVIWPEDNTLYTDVINKTTTVIEKLQSTIPITIFNRGYELYETVSEKLEYVEDRKKKVKDYYDNFLADEAAYNHELDTRLNAYLKVQEKMAEKFVQLKQIIDGYENLWEGAYFEGAGDYGNYYNYDTTNIQYSAFDANGIRNYLRGGGNRFTLLSSLRALAEYSAAYEAIATDLMAQIQMLDIEMDALLGGGLYDYAAQKGKTLKNFYHFRDEYNTINWIRLGNNSYFDLHDIEYIMNAVSGDTQMIQLMKDYRSELLGYLGASSVNNVKVSNRMHDIYKYASRVYELYDGSFYTGSLMTEDQRTELLQIYRNGTGTGDIEGTLYDITDKHNGTAYGFYNLPSDNGTDSYNPMGSFAEPSLSGDRVEMTAPLYHPVTSSITNASATVSVYGDNGWEPLDTGSTVLPMTVAKSGGSYLSSNTELGLFGTNNNVEIVIDKENDTISMYTAGLENNTEYKFDWDISYTVDGYTMYEEGDMIKTITYEPTVVVKATMQEDSSTSAIVTVTNLTGNTLSGSYVYVNGYGEDGEPIATAGTPLDTLDNMQTAEITLELDKPVYSVFAYVEDTESTIPTSLIIKNDGVDASNIFAQPSSTLQYTAEVFDPLGNLLSGENVTWTVTPSEQGINVENGMVSIGENTLPGSYTITATASSTAYDEVILTIADSKPQSGLIFNGLTKSGGLITGGLTLRIVNDDAGLESCDIMIAIYEKDKNKLEGLKKVTITLNQGTNEIELEDLLFSVPPAKIYEVRIFSWTAVNTLMPIIDIFISDI